MDLNVQGRKRNLETKIPELRKALQAAQMLCDKKARSLSPRWCADCRAVEGKGRQAV
jgi:hypothetical protein